MKDLWEILKEYFERIFTKQANVNIVVSYPGKNKCSLHIEMKWLKGNWRMGNSSFLINHNRYNLVNPVMVYENKKYSTGDYEPIEMKSLLQNKVIAFQLRCSGEGEQVAEEYETICGVEFDMLGDELNLKWRSIDTAVVTPDFKTINCNYTLTYN